MAGPHRHEIALLSAIALAIVGVGFGCAEPDTSGGTDAGDAARAIDESDTTSATDAKDAAGAVDTGDTGGAELAPDSADADDGAVADNATESNDASDAADTAETNNASDAADAGTDADQSTVDVGLGVGRPSGQSCALGAECTTGHCVDGVCCNTSCDGQCQACDVAGSIGTCKPVTGMPHWSAQPHRPRCGGDPACAGTCNGVVTDRCTFQANQCRAASCSSGAVAINRAVCDDTDGSCPTLSAQACPNACIAATGTCGGTCRPGAKQCAGVTPQTCDDSGVWQSAAPCGGATPRCDPVSHACVKANKGDACGGNDQCTTGHCVGGVCCESACDGACDTATCGGGTCLHKPARTACDKREGPHAGWNDVIATCDAGGNCVFPIVPCGPDGAACDLATNACCQNQPSTFESVTIACVPPSQCCDGATTCMGLPDQRWFGCKSTTECPVGLTCCARAMFFGNFGEQFTECRDICPGTAPDYFTEEVCDTNLPASQCQKSGATCHEISPDYNACY